MKTSKNNISAAPARETPGFSASEQRDIIEERNQWFYSLEVPRKQEKLFELEVFLKGLDRFFNTQNLPISEKGSIVNRDFTNELKIIRNAVARVVKLSQGLLTEEDNKAMHFQAYVDSKLLNDYQRAKSIERALLQRTPEESLYVLCHTFINFQEILQTVTGQKKNSYFLFYHLEQLISREITGNRFFNPFKSAGFAPHYDVVKSPRFVRLIRGIGSPAIRRRLSVIFLMMFKLLRYLSFINPEAKDLESLKDSLLIYSLVNSESMLLIDLLKNEMRQVIEDADHTTPEVKNDILDHLDAFTYPLSSELKKIFELELRDAAQTREINLLQNGVSRSRGLLTNIFQQGIVHLGQAIDPDLEGKDVFPDFISRLEESLKLRRDIWLFHKIIDNLERVIEQSQLKSETIPLIEAIKTLRNFIFYYQNISFQFVRCYDREDFQKFFSRVDKFLVTDVNLPEKLEAFRKDLHAFKMFMEATLANINNRAELQDMPFGTEEGERLLAQFLV